MPAKQMPAANTLQMRHGGTDLVRPRRAASQPKAASPEWICGSLDSWNLILFLSCDFSNCAAKSPVPARRCLSPARPVLCALPENGFLTGYEERICAVFLPAPCSCACVRKSQRPPKAPKDAPQDPKAPNSPHLYTTYPPDHPPSWRLAFA